MRVKPNHLPTPPQGEKLPECLVSDNDRTGAFFLKCNEASGHLFPCCKHRLHAPARAAPERAISDTDTLPHLPPALRGRGPLAAWTAAWRSGGRTHAPGWPPAYHSKRGHAPTREPQRAGPRAGRALTVALSRTLMEPGSATLCFRRACSSSWRGGRSHFPKTTKSMSLGKRKVTVNRCSPRYADPRASGGTGAPAPTPGPPAGARHTPMKPGPPGERERSSRSICRTRMASRKAPSLPGR